MYKVLLFRPRTGSLFDHNERDDRYDTHAFRAGLSTPLRFKMQTFSTIISLTALAAVPLVNAHGFVQTVTAGGQTYNAVNDPVRTFQPPRL